MSSDQGPVNKSDKNFEDTEIGSLDAASNSSASGPKTAPPASKAGGDSSAGSKDEINKLRSDYLYLLAEFENFKKHAIKDRAELRKYGSERLVADLLNVMDVFETALATKVTPDTVGNYIKGIEMTAHELRQTLTRHGVEEIPSLGSPFDPASHEALTSEVTSEMPSGHVLRVFKKPYRLHDRVVRYGQVVVAKSPEGGTQ